MPSIMRFLAVFLQVNSGTARKLTNSLMGEPDVNLSEPKRSISSLYRNTHRVSNTRNINFQLVRKPTNSLEMAQNFVTLQESPKFPVRTLYRAKSFAYQALSAYTVSVDKIERVSRLGHDACRHRVKLRQGRVAQKGT